MVSQFTGRQDSPVDPCEAINHDSGDTHGWSGVLDMNYAPCQSNVKLGKHKAAWINPLCAQQPLQDLQPRCGMVQNSGKLLAVDKPSPLGISSSALGDSLAETPPSKATARGSRERISDVSPNKGKQGLLGCAPGSSLLKTPKNMVTSCSSDVTSACFVSPHAAASVDEGAVQGRSRSLSPSLPLPATFLLPADVEKENIHFYAADLIISLMERMKCAVLSPRQPESWSPEEASRSTGNGQGDSGPPARQELGSSAFSDSGCEGSAVLQGSPMMNEASSSPVVKEACKWDLDEFIVSELGKLDDATETRRSSYNSLKSVAYRDFNSAELLARELLRGFRKCWMLSEVDYLLPASLAVASSVAGNEEHVPEDFDPSVDTTQEITLKSRVSGTEDWAPPGFQIILNVHRPLKRDVAVVAQNFVCAGCGTPIEPKFVKRLRYCNYLGKYFCECCHCYAESCIPARILTTWDFRKYHVSNFSKGLLDSIWHQPIFSLQSLGHGLYAKAKELDRVKDIQEQLFHVKKMLKTCRFADSVLQEFEQVPSHLTDECHLFSLEDLLRTKKGLLAPLLKDILKASLLHVANCELCKGKGFICEFCRSTAVIFPFQTTTCRRCEECKACFHKVCFQSSWCPRCARITARRRLLESSPSATT